MTDWADDIAERWSCDPHEIAEALRTERRLAQAIEAACGGRVAVLEGRIIELNDQLRKSRDLARERLRTLKGMEKAGKGRTAASGQMRGKERGS